MLRFQDSLHQKHDMSVGGYGQSDCMGAAASDELRRPAGPICAECEFSCSRTKLWMMPSISRLCRLGSRPVWRPDEESGVLVWLLSIWISSRLGEAIPNLFIRFCIIPFARRTAQFVSWNSRNTAKQVKIGISRRACSALCSYTCVYCGSHIRRI
jgi:hypothetical protein